MAPSGDHRWLGPDDQWPRHDKPWFRDALRMARGAGWLCRKLSGHSDVEVSCSDPSKVSSPCRMLIFSTGRGGESVALELKRMIRNCDHGDRGTVVVEAAALVEKAEKLTDAAENLATRDSLEAARELRLARVDELIEQALQRVHEADNLLTEAMTLEDGAVSLETEVTGAEERVRTLLGIVNDVPLPESEEVVSSAEQSVKEARRSVITLPQETLKRELLARLTRLKERLVKVRTLLSELRHSGN